MPGTFITFEGIDGSGKSTQLRLLGNFLRANGCDALLTREPGGTTLGLRFTSRVARRDGGSRSIDRVTGLCRRPRSTRASPAASGLEAGQVVISDRYADATVAYQGAGRGFSPELISQIVQLATEGLKPDLTLLFDLRSRSQPAAQRDAQPERTRQIARDRLDIENADFHARVRDAYLQIALAEPERVKLIDTSGPVEQHAGTRSKRSSFPFLQSRGHIGDELCLTS